MSESRRVILLTPLAGNDLQALLDVLGPGIEVEVISDANALARAQVDALTIVIAYGSGVIVSPRHLEACDGAYNFHGAPPEYPGRDPHHFAAYDAVSVYGATAHEMLEEVDAGAIVGVRRVPVDPKCGPGELLAVGRDAMFDLFALLAPDMVAGRRPPLLPAERWGRHKTTRNEFLSMCRIDSLLGEAELRRRAHAFQMPGHDNLRLRLHGLDFRLAQGVEPVHKEVPSPWDEFTEGGYQRLLDLALERGYRFICFEELRRGPIEGRHLLWRHDVDFSPQRAHALAEIEAKYGVRATYFVNPRARTYSLLDPDVIQLFKSIAGMGHSLGLHFDSEALAIEGLSTDQLEQAIQREAELVERLLGCEVNAFSWHNPGDGWVATYRRAYGRQDQCLR